MRVFDMYEYIGWRVNELYHHRSNMFLLKVLLGCDYRQEGKMTDKDKKTIEGRNKNKKQTLTQPSQDNLLYEDFFQPPQQVHDKANNIE